MRRYLRNLLRRRPRTQRPIRNMSWSTHRSLQIDALESRRLLAATAHFSAGELSVSGDSNNNEIAVTFQNDSGANYLIVKDGTTTIFDGTPTQQNVETSDVTGITVSGAAGNDAITLGDVQSANGFTGLNGAVFVSGDEGDDSIVGSHFSDTLSGGAGSDSYVFDADAKGHDEIIEAANLDTDVFDFSEFGNGVAVQLGSTSTQWYGAGSSLKLSDNAGIENIIGTAFADALQGNSRHNWIDGGDDSDAIDGGLGDDTILGGGGPDSIFAGSGDDIIDGEGGINKLTYYGTEDSDYLLSTSNTIILSSGSIIPKKIHLFEAHTGGGEDVALLNDSHFVSMGFWGVLFSSGEGDDSVAVMSNNQNVTQPLIGSIIDLGGGNDVANFYGRSGNPTFATDIFGGTGNDSITVYEAATNAIPSLRFDGGAGNDTLTVANTFSEAVTLQDNRVQLTLNDDILFSHTENVNLDTTGADANLITIGPSTVALPSISVTGDATDTLDLTSVPGGTIYSSFILGYTSFILDENIAAVASSGIKNFVLTAQTVSFSGISVDHSFDVTTDFIDPETQQHNRDGHIYFAGDVSVPEGFVPNPHNTLIRNNSNAILHGRFTSDAHIAIGGAKYDVQYVNDVDLDNHNISGGLQVTTEHLKTSHDTIPRFLYTWMLDDASNVNRSISSGNWSDGSNWSFGVVPTAGDLVQITPGTIITYDVNNSVDDIKAIEILGSLVFETDVDTHLFVGTIEVLPGGRLEIGSEAAPISASNEAIVTFADHIPFLEPINGVNIDPSQFGTGLLGYGEVIIHGSPIGTYSDSTAQTWLRLAREVEQGATELLLETALPTGWEVGDSIVLPDTRQLLTDWDHLYKINGLGEDSQTEVLEIAGISADRKTITLSSGGTAYAHDGGQRTDALPGEYETYPHIALLTRNVTLASQDPNGYRGHTLYGARAEVDIRYANFEDLGRVEVATPLGENIDVGASEQVPNQIARYGVHFHHLRGPLNPTNTGYQYKFVGNTSQSGKTWGVTVHGTSYGLVADNVVYNMDGGGYVTEDGTEIGNEFLNNISIKVSGTLRDGELGGDNPAETADFGIARGGSGFWFRRTGNDIIGNVAADSMYAGMVITSYYLFDELALPNFRGANPHIASQGTPTLNNPGGTIEDNEFYGKSRFGIWMAYLTGDNLNEFQPEVVIKDTTLWNAALSSFVTMYHTANVTFDNLTILSDTDSQTRGDTGVVGVDMRVYENINTKILNSSIEGTYRGIIHANSTDIPFGGPLEGTLVENTVLKNHINIVVIPSIENRVGAGNYLEVVDTAFVNVDLPETDPAEALNIHMFYSGNSFEDARALNEFSIVKIVNYNQVPGDNFQVFYKEQAADFVMETTDPTWVERFGMSQIGAPTGSTYTNQQLWDDLNLATLGFISPSNAKTRVGIDGLVGVTGEFLDPAADLDLKVVFATPWDGVTITQAAGELTELHIKFNVLGLVPEGGAIKLELTPQGGESMTRNGPLQDGFWGKLAVGHYTLRGYIADASGEAVPGSEHIVEFDIVPE